jgi:hypothetical protein
MGREIPTHIFNWFYWVLFGLSIAVPAVYRFIAARLKRNFSLLAAASAGGRIHLARASVAKAAVITKTLGPSGRTARRTALGLIGEAFGSKKLLLFTGKGERFSAIGTLKRFLCISH